jgi:type IV pilus modification protein PilV
MITLQHGAHSTMFRPAPRAMRRRQSGFTLIEALVALLVMAFGMLAIASLQTTLSRSSDIAKQRSEAVRLAQVKMEELRSFDGIDSGSGAYTYADNVVSNTLGESITATVAGSNTAFTRSWAITRSDGATATTGDDLEKWINVQVVWNDRAGQQQRVTLNSVIARNNPVALKGLIAGQARQRVRYPKSRNINIPYPAVTLSGGNTSAFIPPPGTVVYVFDNDTGNILSSCSAPAPSTISAAARVGSTVTVTAAGHPFFTGNRVTVSGASAFNGTYTITNAVAGASFTYELTSPLPAAVASTGGTAALVVNLVEGLDLSTSGLSCTAFTTNAYLLSGYVRFKISGAAPNASNVENTTDTPLDLLSSGPLSFSGSATGSAPSTYACYAQRQKVVAASNLDTETISSLVRSGGVVTLTTVGSHTFTPGLRIAVEFMPVVAGTTNWNNSFTVLSVTSNTLTYAQDGEDSSVSGGGVGNVSLIQQITIPEVEAAPSGYTQVESRFIAYTCIVTPYDDGNATTPALVWWGEVTLVPSGWSIGSTASTYRVCRFSGDYIANGSVSNHEHPRYYRGVSGALDNQNYLVVRGNDDCPTDVAADPLNADYINTNTVAHQGGSGSPALSFRCVTAACTGGNKVDTEPASATTPVDMF